MELPELVWVRLCTSTYGMAVFAMSHDGRVGQSSSDPFGAAQFGRAVARPHRPVSYVALNVVLNAAASSLALTLLRFEMRLAPRATASAPA